VTRWRHSTTRASNSLSAFKKHQPVLPPVERVRLVNSASRAFDCFQSGCLTLLKMQAGGAQRVELTHQQVYVGPGGQAVVAERVAPGRKRGSRKGAGAKNGR